MPPPFNGFELDLHHVNWVTLSKPVGFRLPGSAGRDLCVATVVRITESAHTLDLKRFLYVFPLLDTCDLSLHRCQQASFRLAI